METENKLLWLAYEELLELRGFLTQAGYFDPDYDKLEEYWLSGKPEWEKELKKSKEQKDGKKNFIKDLLIDIRKMTGIEILNNDDTITTLLDRQLVLKIIQKYDK